MRPKRPAVSDFIFSSSLVCALLWVFRFSQEMKRKDSAVKDHFLRHRLSYRTWARVWMYRRYFPSSSCLPVVDVVVTVAAFWLINDGYTRVAGNSSSRKPISPTISMSLLPSLSSNLCIISSGALFRLQKPRDTFCVNIESLVLSLFILYIYMYSYLYIIYRGMYKYIKTYFF